MEPFSEQVPEPSKPQASFQSQALRRGALFTTVFSEEEAQPDLGELFTLGYAEDNALSRLDAFLMKPKTGLVDIRFRPHSRWYPAFNPKALIARYGAHKYGHCQELGNVNYNRPGEPIALWKPEEGALLVARLLQRGYSIMLLCACKHYLRCHRRNAYNLIIHTLHNLGETAWLNAETLDPDVVITSCSTCNRTWHQRWDDGKIDERERCSYSLQFCQRCHKCIDCCKCFPIAHQARLDW